MCAYTYMYKTYMADLCEMGGALFYQVGVLYGFRNFILMRKNKSCPCYLANMAHKIIGIASCW